MIHNTYLYILASVLDPAHTSLISLNNKLTHSCSFSIKLNGKTPPGLEGQDKILNM